MFWKLLFRIIYIIWCDPGILGSETTAQGRGVTWQLICFLWWCLRQEMSRNEVPIGFIVTLWILPRTTERFKKQRCEGFPELSATWILHQTIRSESLYRKLPTSTCHSRWQSWEDMKGWWTRWWRGLSCSPTGSQGTQPNWNLLFVYPSGFTI